MRTARTRRGTGTVGGGPVTASEVGPRARFEGRRPAPDAVERARLRGTFGALLVSERRAGAGWSQRRLAEAVGVAEITVRQIERGWRRPDESLCRALAVALRPHGDPVDVAVLDLQLQAAAGESLRRWNRRRPRSARWQRAYSLAAERLAAEPVPSAALDVAAGRLLAALDEAAGR